MKYLFALCIAVALIGTQAKADFIIPVANAGSVVSFFPLQDAFDTQPTFPIPDTVVAAGSGAGLGAAVPGFSNRGGFIDFGVNYADYQITEIWTAYRSSSNVITPVPFDDVFWSDVADDQRGAPGTFTNQTDINFGTTPVLTNGSTVDWIQDRDFTASPIPIPRRFLIVLTGDDGFQSGRATEFAIVGNVVPEPASALAILGLGGMMLLARRR